MHTGDILKDLQCRNAIVIMEESIPISLEMFYQRIKVISQSNFALICHDTSH